MTTPVSALRQPQSAPLSTTRACPPCAPEILHCPGARPIPRPVNVNAVLSRAHESLTGALSQHIKCATANERSVFELNLKDLEGKLSERDARHGRAAAAAASQPAGCYIEPYAEPLSCSEPQCGSLLDLNQAFLTDPCPLSARMESTLAAYHLSAPASTIDGLFGSMISIKKYRTLCRERHARISLRNGFDFDAVLFDHDHDSEKINAKASRKATRHDNVPADPEGWSVYGFYQLAQERNYCTLSVLLILVNLYALCARTAQGLVQGTLRAPAPMTRHSGAWRSLAPCTTADQALRLHSLPRRLSCFLSLGVWFELRQFLETLGLLSGQWTYPEFSDFTRLLRMLLESRYGTDDNGCLVRIARCAKCNAAHVEFINTKADTIPRGPVDWHYDEKHGGYRYLNGSNVCPVCHCTESTYIEPNPHDDWVYQEL